MLVKSSRTISGSQVKKDTVFFVPSSCLSLHPLISSRGHGGALDYPSMHWHEEGKVVSGFSSIVQTLIHTSRPCRVTELWVEGGGRKTKTVWLRRKCVFRHDVR